MPKWRPLSGLGLVWALAGCDACAPRPPAVRPARFIDPGAEGVIEIRDIGVLGRAKAAILARLGGVVTPSQLRALVRELELSLGFDPTSPDGLRAAGLPPNGAVAVLVAGGGRGALWVVPVTDRGPFEKAVERVVRARTPVDDVQPFQTEVARGRRFMTQFGPKTVVVAGYVIHRGHALIGVGRTAEGLVRRALEVSEAPAGGIDSEPAYVLLAKELGDAWEVRWIAPSGQKTLSKMLERVGRHTGFSAPPHLGNAVQSLGGIIDFEGRQARMHGRVYLTPRGRARWAEVLDTPSPAGSGALAALDLPDAMLHVRLAGRPVAMLGAVAPPGSPLRRRVDRLFARVNREAQVDVSREVLPRLSGHAALSVGLRDVESMSFRELARDPLAASWAAFGFGVGEPELPRRWTARVEPRLSNHGFTLGTRGVGEPSVRVLAAKRPGALPLLETFSVGDAWVFSTEARVTEQIVNRQRPAHGQHPSPGLRAQLRFGPLSRHLETLRSGDLPLLYRSVARKVVDLVRLFDAGELRVSPTGDAIAVDATISLVSSTGGGS